MESIYKFIYKQALLLSLLFVVSGNVFGACYGDIQRGGGTLCSPKACTWERSDRRCNDNSECCPGKSCSSFGYCELCC